MSPATPADRPAPPVPLSPSPAPAEPARSAAASRRRWRLGLLCLTTVVVLWVASSFLVNSIFESGEYRKPYMVTYLNTATFSLYLVKPLLARWRQPSARRRDKTAVYAPAAAAAAAPATGGQADLAISVLANPFDAEPPAEAPAAAGLSLAETARLSLEFCLLWFFANWFSNACLSYTSVASATILSCTSSFFTLAIGSLFRVERFTRIKIVAVAVSLLGVILISTQDSSSETEATEDTHSAGAIVLGDLMSLASAAVYGLYTTLLKLRIGDESRINMQLFFGFVGLCNLLLLWPALVVLHVTGAETIEAPPTARVWLIVIVNAMSTLVSDYVWILAILMTSPLVVTVGLSATIPLAMLGDFVFNDHVVGAFYFLGAALVCVAFFLVNKDAEAEAVGAADAADAADAELAPAGYRDE
ncbi:uncharacterized protein V1510DRAFT_370869 [Dipodascopsis tothii]|uniref:uncharacterized protein n=1 Tax=Dipodascopsis tothii TaxID=44089 RepID=UPI0034CF674B